MATKNNEQNAQTALATVGGFCPPADTDITAMMTEELDGLEMSFERIRIPSGGGTMFELPGEDGDDTENVKEFSGVILYHHALHAFYKEKYTGGNNPPDCGSFDGKAGNGTPGGNCQSCPYNQFGTGENGAKACKNKRRVYILREGEMFPLLLTLPTGSLKDFTRYIKRLLGKGKVTSQVVTKFSLKKAQNTKGVVYSQAQFVVDRALTQEEYTHTANWAAQIKEMSKKVDFDYDSQDDAATDILVDHETGELMQPLTAQNASADVPLPTDAPPPSDGDFPF